MVSLTLQTQLHSVAYRALPQRREVPTNSGSVFICRSFHWLVWFKLLIFCFKNPCQKKKARIINLRSIVRNEIVTLLCEGLHPAPQMGTRALQGVLWFLLRSNRVFSQVGSSLNSEIGVPLCGGLLPLGMHTSESVSMLSEFRGRGGVAWAACNQ